MKDFASRAKFGYTKLVVQVRGDHMHMHNLSVCSDDGDSYPTVLTVDESPSFEWNTWSWTVVNPVNMLSGLRLKRRIILPYARRYLKLNLVYTGNSITGYPPTKVTGDKDMMTHTSVDFACLSAKEWCTRHCVGLKLWVYVTLETFTLTACTLVFDRQQTPSPSLGKAPLPISSSTMQLKHRLSPTPRDLSPSARAWATRIKVSMKVVVKMTTAVMATATVLKPTAAVTFADDDFCDDGDGNA
ncbi:hypothetical protein EV360DRAFT_71384 [Lentinula raphanica]|nr:hypothetical protein EV360DRAFT_71384 [Lentinula raphanica]